MIENSRRASSWPRAVGGGRAGGLARVVAVGLTGLVAGTLVACTAKPASPELQGVVEYEERTLSFELGGRVVRVDVKRGDVVADGKVLATIDDTLEKLARASRADDAAGARADLALLEAGARREDISAIAAQVRGAVAAETLARSTAARARSLHDAAAISQTELDRANADLDRTTAERNTLEQRLASLQRGARSEEIARARARLEGATNAELQSDERIARHALRAKAPGEVLDVHIEPGEMVAAGTPVVTVADTSHPYVEVFVAQGALSGIRVGTKATVRVDSERAPLSGTVEHVAPRTEFTPRYLFSERERPNLVVRVRVRLEDPERRAHAGVPAFVTVAR